MSHSSRRKFLQQLGGTGLLLTAGPLAVLPATEKMEKRLLQAEKRISFNDQINIAVIGMGIMGNNDVKTALKIPGVRLVAACDLYSGRLDRARELYGKDLFTTPDYKQILERSDVDAVIVSPNDSWHARISIEAMNKGKAVYCEKPMVHHFDEGQQVIETQQRTKKTMQVGSQRVSSLTYAKAHELFKAGEIGQLNCVEASFDRQNALGAWEYTMPTDASPKTVDWDRYMGHSGEPYDAKKFFWWRNYRQFGTGVAGDLFVHLLSGIHVVTGSKGPEKIHTSAQLSYWKDGRDVPDVMCSIMQYPDSPEHPAFEVMLRVNFISGQGEAGIIRFIGSEGVLEMVDRGFILRHHKMPKAPGIGGWDALQTYPKAMQDELLKVYDQRYSKEDRQADDRPALHYVLPEGSDDHVNHFTNFFEGMRTGSPVNEGPVFGFRAAAPCLAANESYFQKKIIYWDPVNMKVKEQG